MSSGKESFSYSLSDIDDMSQMAKALSSPIRLEILKLLNGNSRTMSELSKLLYVSMSSISMHTAILKDAGLITIIPKPGMHGAQKLCGIRAGLITFEIQEKSEKEKKPAPKVLDIPIGQYIHAEIAAPCGLVKENGYIEMEDTPYSFFHPEHVQAQLIWFTTGYLQYNILNRDLQNLPVEMVKISFEVCAEAPGYNNDWPTDIFVKINDREITTFRVKGDYGGNRGINNPSWWKDSNTQYGDLELLSIGRDGTYLNGSKVSEETIQTLKLREGLYFSFTLGVDPKSEHPGGMNLFGKKFGNYTQNIRVEILYR